METLAATKVLVYSQGTGSLENSIQRRNLKKKGLKKKLGIALFYSFSLTDYSMGCANAFLV